MEIIEKAKGFLGDPSKGFSLYRDETPEEAVKYYLVIAVVYSFLCAITTAVIYAMVSPLVSDFGLMTEPYGFVEIFSSFFMTLILMLISVFIWGALLHLFAYLLGGRQDIMKTLRAAMYASTPLALIGWIPLLGIIGWIWVCALDVIGLNNYQDISPGRAIAAVVVPVVSLFVIAIAIVGIAITIIVPIALEGFSVPQ